MRLLGSRQRVFFLLCLIGIPVGVACGTDSVDIPFDPQILPDGGGGTDPDAKAPTDGGGDADADVTCAPLTPNDAIGVFVTDAGTDAALCGTRDKPCKTIAFGIGRAQTLTKGRVFLSAGTFAEHVVMEAGITLEGGWSIGAGNVWTRACVTPDEATIIRAPVMSASAIEAVDLGGVAGLSTLHVQGKAQALVAKGDSLYGIMATGATTTLTLTDVLVTVGNAGDGKDGAAGGAGAIGGVAGSCVAGVATPGTAGTSGTGAAAGTFDATGWVAPLGTNGTVGTAGDNGAAGAAGTCANCVTCDFATACVPVDAVDNCGTNGANGCGGGAGGAGIAAGAGGSAVGIFVWDAIVQVSAGRIKVGDGGAGGVGGAGGTSGVATVGKAGTVSAACTVSCALGAAACTETKAAGPGGTAGGAGGLGGAGGQGGGGAGGSAVGIYQGGAGVVTTANGTTLVVGKAGKGGGTGTAAGAAGLSAAKIP